MVAGSERIEDGISVIGECSASPFLHQRLQYTPEQEDVLRSLGWKEPMEGVTPNWHIEATSDEQLLEPGRMTERTLLEVFGLGYRDRAVIKFQERVLQHKVS